MSSTYLPEETLRGRRRVRVGPRTQIACLNCKDRKHRCDDQLPSCSNCQRHGLTCLIEDPATRRRHVRNYLEILERKIAGLEQQLLDANPDATIAHTDQPTEHRNAVVQPVAQESCSNPGCINELSSHVGTLGLKTYSGEPHYLGSSSAFAFSRVLHTSLQSCPLNRTSNTSALEDGLPGLPSSQYPEPMSSYDVRRKFTNAYFENVHPQYPFLHEPTFRIWEDMVNGPASWSHGEASDPVPLFFVNMVYAIGALLLRVPASLAQRFYLSAQRYVDAILVRDNLESIQALLCYAMYSLRSVAGPSVWKLSGLALRLSVQLGYHRKSHRLESSVNPLTLEMRKRVFWCSFGIDCVASLTLGRPLSLRPQEIDADLPGDFNDAQLTEEGILGLPRDPFSDFATNMSTAIHVFRLHILWARIHTSLYSDTTAVDSKDPAYLVRVEGFRQELDEWLASVPPVPHRVRPALSIFATTDWYELNHSDTILMIHRGQLASGQPPQEDGVLVQCAQAAAKICHRYRAQYMNTEVNFTWGSLHVLFSAGLTYLHCVWMSPVVRETQRYEEINRTLTDCTMLLVVLAERWKSAEPYRNIFEALSQKTLSMVTRGRDGDGNTAMSAAAVTNGNEPNDLSQWATQISETGMSERIDEFLRELLEDCCSYEEAIEIGQGAER